MSTTPRVDAIWRECGSLPASEFTTRITELAMEMENELAARGNTLADFEASMVEHFDSEAILEIPTPETNAAIKTVGLYRGDEMEIIDPEFALDLERRLTIAREALKKLDNWLMRDAQRKQIIEQALTQTAPKQCTKTQ